MNDLISLILIIALIGAIAFIVKRPIKQLAQKTLTLSQYISQYPHCKIDRGIKCAACGSTSIKNWGVKSANDHRRIFICNHCNTRLYRSDDW